MSLLVVFYTLYFGDSFSVFSIWRRILSDSDASSHSNLIASEYYWKNAAPKICDTKEFYISLISDPTHHSLALQIISWDILIRSYFMTISCFSPQEWKNLVYKDRISHEELDLPRLMLWKSAILILCLQNAVNALPQSANVVEAKSQCWAPPAQINVKTAASAATESSTPKIQAFITSQSSIPASSANASVAPDRIPNPASTLVNSGLRYETTLSAGVKANGPASAIKPAPVFTLEITPPPDLLSCPVLNDQFMTLDKTRWRTGGNWEYEAYVNSDNITFIGDGGLHIKSLFSQDITQFDVLSTTENTTWDFNKPGPWNPTPSSVNPCTSSPFFGCLRDSSTSTLPPVFSGQVRTNGDFCIQIWKSWHCCKDATWRLDVASTMVTTGCECIWRLSFIRWDWFARIQGKSQVWRSKVCWTQWDLHFTMVSVLIKMIIMQILSEKCYRQVLLERWIPHLHFGLDTNLHQNLYWWCVDLW